MVHYSAVCWIDAVMNVHNRNWENKHWMRPIHYRWSGGWWIFNNNNNTNNNNSHFRHPLTKSSQSMCSNKTNTSKTLMNKNVLIQHVRKVTSDGWQLIADRALHDDCPLYMKWSQVKSDHEYVVGYMTGFWPIYNSFSWPYSNID